MSQIEVEMSWVEVEMSWVEVDGAGWRQVHGLVILNNSIFFHSEESIEKNIGLRKHKYWQSKDRGIHWRGTVKTCS